MNITHTFVEHFHGDSQFLRATDHYIRCFYPHGIPLKSGDEFVLESRQMTFQIRANCMRHLVERMGLLAADASEECVWPAWSAYFVSLVSVGSYPHPSDSKFAPNMDLTSLTVRVSPPGSEARSHMPVSSNR